MSLQSCAQSVDSKFQFHLISHRICVSNDDELVVTYQKSSFDDKLNEFQISSPNRKDCCVLHYCATLWWWGNSDIKLTVSSCGETMNATLLTHCFNGRIERRCRLRWFWCWLSGLFIWVNSATWVPERSADSSSCIIINISSSMCSFKIHALNELIFSLWRCVIQLRVLMKRLITYGRNFLTIDIDVIKKRNHCVRVTYIDEFCVSESKAAIVSRQCFSLLLKHLHLISGSYYIHRQSSSSSNKPSHQCERDNCNMNKVANGFCSKHLIERHDSQNQKQTSPFTGLLNEFSISQSPHQSAFTFL